MIIIIIIIIYLKCFQHVFIICAKPENNQHFVLHFLDGVLTLDKAGCNSVCSSCNNELQEIVTRKWCMCTPHALRCQNGGTCHNAGATYRCQCQPSFTGYDCGIDIDECQFNPCQQGASCNNTFGDYNCHCPSRYTGKDCTLDKCRMAKADVVFLVDSSLSQGPDRFKTQLDFIGEFVKSVYVGSDYVQIGLITFSFVAKVEFELTRYSRQSDLLDALQNIKYNAGSTNTAAALKMAREDVLSKSRASVRKLAILLTDGMSSNKLDTIYQSALLRNSDVTIVGIGIGSEILHEELLKITANPNNVFTVSTFDGLYSILSNIRLLSCDVCSEKTTDLLYLLDTSGRHSLSQFHGAIEALQSITSFIGMGISKVKVSLVTYASEPKRIFDFRTYTSENEIHHKIQVLDRDSKSVANLTRALWYVSQNVFTTSSGARNDSRHVIVLLTNGKDIDADAMKHVNRLKGSGKSIVTIAYGKDIARETLLNVASEPYMFFNLGEELFTDGAVLSTMKTLFEFNTCSL
ncbi:hypothetical protein ACJMK2_011810 [Sinanodonta woodiana]|uniref:Uncharacterized protein n=1 Tax=Sinanodonta woodiana TaxID=1069815 RepID=A0ABD3V6L2_SINWO